MTIGINVDVKLRSPSRTPLRAHIDTSTLIYIHLIKGYGSKYSKLGAIYQEIYLNLKSVNYQIND